MPLHKKNFASVNLNLGQKMDQLKLDSIILSIATDPNNPFPQN